MKSFKILITILLLALGTSNINAQSFNNYGNFLDFQILPAYLENGKVKIDPVTATTSIKYSVQYSRATGFPTDMKYAIGTLDNSSGAKFLDQFRQLTNSNFSTGQYIRRDTITVNIKRLDLVAGKRIYLFTQTADQGSVIVFPNNSYEFIIGDIPAPADTPPVPGAVPLYLYQVRGPSNGLDLPDHWYYSLQTKYEGQNVDDGEPVYAKMLTGTIGYVFLTQVSGTVPLYQFYKGYDNMYSTTAATIPSGYTMNNNVIGYVYNNNITPKTRPVYQHGNIYDSTHYYVDGPGTREGFNLDGIAFYLLMKPHPNPTYPLPEEDTEELYQYYSNQGDHFYTTIKKDRPGYAYEKVLGYVHSIQKTGTVPLHRYVNPTAPSGDHYYTINKQNYGGYTYEGIVGYVYATSGYPNTSAIYSYFAPSTANHYYNTVNTNYGGYTNEGVKFYMLSYNH